MKATKRKLKQMPGQDNSCHHSLTKHLGGKNRTKEERKKKTKNKKGSQWSVRIWSTVVVKVRTLSEETPVCERSEISYLT